MSVAPTITIQPYVNLTFAWNFASCIPSRESPRLWRTAESAPSTFCVFPKACVREASLCEKISAAFRESGSIAVKLLLVHGRLGFVIYSQVTPQTGSDYALVWATRPLKTDRD